jgi:hypothetical protein
MVGEGPSLAWEIYGHDLSDPCVKRAGQTTLADTAYRRRSENLQATSLIHLYIQNKGTPVQKTIQK